MKRTENSRTPIIHANLNNLERELQQLAGSYRPAGRRETTGFGAAAGHAPAHDSAVAAGD